MSRRPTESGSPVCAAFNLSSPTWIGVSRTVVSGRYGEGCGLGRWYVARDQVGSRG
jgi:hypothetical protein